MTTAVPPPSDLAIVVPAHGGRRCPAYRRAPVPRVGAARAQESRSSRSSRVRTATSCRRRSSGCACARPVSACASGSRSTNSRSGSGGSGAWRSDFRERLRHLLGREAKPGPPGFPWVSYSMRLASLRSAIRASKARRVLAMRGKTCVMTVVACTGLGKRVVISERNDPAVQRLGVSVADWRPGFIRAPISSPPTPAPRCARWRPTPRTRSSASCPTR